MVARRTPAVTAAAGFDFDVSKRVIGGFGSPHCSRCFFEPGNTDWSIAGLQSEPQLSFADRKFYEA